VDPALSRSALNRRALDRHLCEAAWRHERTINWLRTFIWLTIGCSLFAASRVTGKPDIMSPVFISYGVVCAAFGFFVLRRRYHPWIPNLSTMLDLTVLTSSSFVLCDMAYAEEPVLRALVISGVAIGMMLILATNALRMDWRVAVVTGVYAVVCYLYVRMSLGVGELAYYAVDATILSCETFIITLAIRRNRQVAEQLFGEMRALHDQRVQVMGRLVAGAAHELNTPLGTLQSGLHTLERAAHMLQRHPDRADRGIKAIVEATASARSSIERIDTVLSGLKSFSRVDEASVQDVDLRPGLESAMALVRSQAPAGTRFATNFDATPSVRGNPAQLNQVFLNILRNSVEAMKGSGLIEVSAQVEDDCVVVRLRDEGPGIPPELIERVFEPAFNRQGPRVRLGLGLAVSRSIIQDHGGELHLESEVGRGTTTVIRLPIALSSQDEMPAQASPSLPTGSEPQPQIPV
jgi:signal transduction histidine kinase